MINIGTLELADAYIGSTPVEKAYISSQLVWEKSSPVLPYDAEIEYLEKGSGTNSLIDLGTNANAIFEITAQTTRTASSSMTLVNRHSASVGGAWFGVISSGKWGLTTNAGGYSNVSALNKTDISVDFTVNPVVGTINGNTFSRARGNNNSHWFLFGSSSNGYPFIGRLYSLKAYIGGKLTFDLIPCRIGDVGYLYNKVSKSLLGNVNSNPFILGPDVT